MRSRRRLVSDHELAREIWPSFTDVMSTMALILFVLVLLAYVQNLIGARRLDAFGHQISVAERRLQTLQQTLDRTAADVEEGKARLRASTAQLAYQQRVVTESKAELVQVRSRLEAIAVLRVDVLDKLRRAIEAELGPSHAPDAGALVSIGDNGDIVINESLVFEFGSYAVKNEAKPLLDTLARALGSLLADDGVRENIDAIVIQGHTDERGSDALNWDLSSKRADAVLDFLFDANRVLATSYGGYFAASAYSRFRPLDPAKTEAAFQRNRRIEISVIPKDANIRKVIDEYMQTTGSAPAAPDRTP
jgi:chemotaxis protein MotB